MVQNIIDHSESVICVICARGGSKGLPRKNLKLLDNEPLIVRAIRHARESGVVDVVLVSTDDEEIAKVSETAGAVVPFLRPADLSGDLATTEQTIQHALLAYESSVKRQFDIAVFITPTDIFRNVDWIREAVYRLILRPELESVFSGYTTHKNFWEQQKDGSWVRLREWMAVYSSRQIRRSIIREDTGLACASRAWLWRMGRRIGDKVDVILNTDSFSAIDIHLDEDLKLAQAALNIRKIQ
jgi:CMP-N,N'-diacetyllegionaminic acid synthase